ncbi:fumarylacetoacetate hydrolase family protein [Magnetospirillum aberrantis]|uniref:Fumarylacetoacetate hydrolase family protein n=1 Tax=Magnetospirillum aberrantis SpK TaxID=908842 RepID=A0A7C9UVN7_9PROT|nr:fumarylacetoacetate hydrolase family protein [Magnetospirillum aberrantis]NFV79552.1 fumarylacetoacetate hydrolase family protein [Magnetospirillum aberrantis SpK]
MLFTLPQPAVPVAGEDTLYPVRRVFCVGRNYAGHAREMGSDPNREPPFYFTKAADTLVPGGGAIPYPPATANLHHEVELVVALGASVFQATPEQATKAVFGHAIGLDMTRRDLQFAARDKGRPWDLGKSFEFSAPITPLIRSAQPIVSGAITLTVNGEIRQRGDISDMIWSVPEVIAHLSQYYHLSLGDLIYTGTPEGVGPVRPGDQLVGRIDGLGELAVTIVNPA